MLLPAVQSLTEALLLTQMLPSESGCTVICSMASSKPPAALHLLQWPQLLRCSALPDSPPPPPLPTVSSQPDRGAAPPTQA